MSETASGVASDAAVQEKLHVYYVVGEASGDHLAADLHDALARRVTDLTISGLGGHDMAERGLDSLFDIEDIAVMGFSAVISRLPTILNRIERVVKDILTTSPDVVVLVDSPDFTHRVAKKVRKQRPDLPIIGYVCPSIWAWRQERGTRMATYLDHVLTLFPFEPPLLKRLNGPAATYVGHPLVSSGIEVRVSPETVSAPAKLLLLPGSRMGEITRLLPIMEEVVQLLSERMPELEFVLPCAPGRHDRISELISSWTTKPTLLRGNDAKKQAFRHADAALAASGTVTLELALYQVPMVATYMLDPIAKRLRPWLKMWTASLPNVIADRVIIQEQFDEYAKPGNIARQLERLLQPTPERNAQLEGFRLVHDLMQTDHPTGDVAAEAVLKVMGERR